MKRYEKYKEVDLPWLKEVPEHWDIKPNKSFLKLSKEVVGNKEKEYELLSLSKQGVRIKGNDDFSGKIPDSFENYQIIKQGQLIMCLFDLDQSAVFSGISNYKGKITSAYDVFDIVNMSKNFVDYYFKYIFQGRKYKIYSKSVRYTIAKNDFKNIKSIIPPMQEQIQIANFLDWKISEIDKLIELEKEKINKTKVIKNKIIDRFLELEKPKSKKLKFIGTFAKGNGIARENLDKEAEYPVILYGDIYTKYNFSFSKVENKINLDVYNLSTKISKNTLLFTTSGETKEDIGKTVIYKGKDNVAIGGDILSFVVNNREIDPTYLMYFLNSTKCLEYKYIFSRGDIIVHISEQKLKEIEISYPIIEIQRKIVRLIDKHLSDVENLISKTNNQITYLEELKQTLISDVVTGKMDVRDIEIPKKFKKGE